jgi:methylated-DNA-[protein]-cysteine S-methyltransferase
VVIRGFALFETAIGHCGIAWSARGIAGLNLPEGNEHRTRARLIERFPGASEQAPPPEIQAAIDSIVQLLAGEPRDLAGLPIDETGVAEFNARVYAIARRIPPGSTLSYGDIARQLGDVALSRAVGQALGQNPFPIVVPCHRVLGADGSLGGFSAQGGVETKRRLLTLERALRQGSLEF